MQTHSNKANNAVPSRLLRRHIGLETEYATVVQTPADQEHPPSRREVYDAVCKSLTQSVPTAKARFDDCRLFLATGGAISLESCFDWMDQPGGLIEGATPECSSPRNLLVCQRAQDRLFADAVAECDLPASVCLLKNSRDAEDHVYGCQENYSADVASGPMLWAYRAGILMLIPMYMLYVAICLTLTFLGVSLLVSLKSVGAIVRGRRPCLESLLDIPNWCIRAAAGLLRIVHAPLTCLLWLVARFTAFRQQRQGLTPFLISRTILCGTGHLNARGKFSLSGKAAAINSMVGMGGYLNERPIYVFGHWLQTMCSESIISPRCLLELLGRRQRLQIGLADSNVADAAEYLKVGATSLVLDMIEAGYAKGLPKLKKPLEALQQIASDWSLIARVATNSGPMTALEIQQAYLHRCRQFVFDSEEPANSEAWDILELWEQMLDAAGQIRELPVDYEPSLAKIDWASKKWLIDQMGSDASLASRKKVDLRYHELSPNGYYHRLTGAVPCCSIVEVDEISSAMRMPPKDTPASRRGNLIREFAGSETAISASWSHVIIGSGKSRRTFAVKPPRRPAPLTKRDRH
ncbi:Pup deamidase/depupylase [Rosistilla oblonga]|nr:Pup deamidase/depupylase [Rosistilla oblonga]